MTEVYVVTVFESGDYTTRPWEVFSTEADAEAYKTKIEAETAKENVEEGLDHYINVRITKHEVK